MARKPKTAGARERALAACPDHARRMIKLLTIHAGQGHPEAADSVARWLEVFPQLKPEIRELDDLATKAEAAWVKAVAFGDPLAERAARDEAAAMKAELLGDDPPVLDRVLASAVVVARLSHDRAARVAAQKADLPGVREARERVLSAAQKRLAAAVKAWQLLAGKKARGMHPKQRLKVFEPDAA